MNRFRKRAKRRCEESNNRQLNVTVSDYNTSISTRSHRIVGVIESLRRRKERTQRLRDYKMDDYAAETVT